MKISHLVVSILTPILWWSCGASRDSMTNNILDIPLSGYIQTCLWRPVISMNENGAWRQARNPFNAGKTPACYLDGRFVPMG